MTSIDDLFRKPYNASSTKRKLRSPTASTSNKASRTTYATSPHPTNGTYAGGIPKLASVADEPSELREEDIAAAGPALPSPSPDPDEDENENEDDEGRFFGGGVSKSEREVLDYVHRNADDDAAAAEAEQIDAAWLRRTALSFERKITRNAEMRAKWPDEPGRFMESEADLDAEVKGLGILSEHAELYAGFVECGCVGSLVGLLSHDNSDVSVAVVQLLGELTGEDSEVDDSQWRVLVGAMMEADVVGLLVQNLGRLDEQREEDREGVYHVLEVLENLLHDAKNLEGQRELVLWLRERVKRRMGGKRVTQNQQYAAEILAVVMQTTGKKNQEAFVEMEGVDMLLELLSFYRKVDPEKDSDEEEWVENLFDCLACLVDFRPGAMAFLSGEGVELCLIMLREGKMSKSRALTVLDHASSGEAAEALCAKVVEAAGLKTLFGMFMKKQDKEATEHLIGVFASLLRYQPANSSGRIRTLAKFVERDYEKIGKLVQLRGEYAEKVRLVNGEIERERKDMSSEEQEEMADEWLSRQLDAGLFPLQTLDVILSWLVAEDDGARKKISELLEGLGILSSSLKEQLAGMNGGAESGETAVSGREMLEALLRCI